MKNEKMKFDFLWWNIGDVFILIGALFLFGFFATFVSPKNFLVVGILVVILGFVIKVFDFNIRQR